ncbi:MAG: GLPGLI family protein [Bacteroidota bacterium]
MKLYQLLFLLLFFASSIFAQQTVVVEYSQKANIEYQLRGETDPKVRARVAAHLSKPRIYTLVVAKGESIYQRVNGEVITDFAAHAEATKRIEIGREAGGAYRNQSEDLFIKEADILGRRFLIYDKQPKIDWTFSKETKEIGQYTCKKASTIHFGEPVVAWYTEEIPLNVGPKEFGHLPGLILEIELQTKTISATKVNFLKDNPYDFKRPTKGKRVTLEAYYGILNEMLANIRKNSNNGTLTIGGGY